MNQISEVFAKTVELLALRGYQRLDQREEPLREKVDQDFEIVLDSKTYQTTAYHKGMPFCQYDPSGGISMSGGEEDLIKALDTQIDELKGND